MLVELDVTVDRPAEQVFDAMADLRLEPAWNPRVTDCELLTGEPVAEDSRFATVVDGAEYDAVLRRHQRPRMLEITTTGAPMTTRTRLAFTDGAAGTVVIGRFERDPRGLRSLLAPFLVRSMRRELRQRLDDFKRYCESPT
jgi:hypothetical protein